MASSHSRRELDRSAAHVNHDLLHPNGSHARSSWGQDQTLHLAVAYNNPCRWRTRRTLFNDFRRHISALPNIKLYVVELAYGDRPFEVTSRDNPRDIQLNSREELWHKENLLNVAISQFEPGWEYGGYCDGDFHFTRHDVALETIDQLQHYDWVQMFSHYVNLGPDHQPVGGPIMSFTRAFHEGVLSLIPTEKQEIRTTYGVTRNGQHGAPGGCWAFRRGSFDRCGGLLDCCILGSGDHHMAMGLASLPDRLYPDFNLMAMFGKNYEDRDPYAKAIVAWQQRAAQVVNGNIGYVPGTCIHHWHGRKAKRGYETRWKILTKHKFNPYVDIYKNSRGVYQLTPNKPGLRDDIRGYFRSRDEDSNEL